MVDDSVQPAQRKHLRARSAGKQVFFDGEHVCDAVTEEAAGFIATALNVGVPPCFGKRSW